MKWTKSLGLLNAKNNGSQLKYRLEPLHVAESGKVYAKADLERPSILEQRKAVPVASTIRQANTNDKSRWRSVIQSPYTKLFGLGIGLGVIMEFSMIISGYYRLLAEGEGRKLAKKQTVKE